MLECFLKLLHDVTRATDLHLTFRRKLQATMTITTTLPVPLSKDFVIKTTDLIVFATKGQNLHLRQIYKVL